MSRSRRHFSLIGVLLLLIVMAGALLLFFGQDGPDTPPAQVSREAPKRAEKQAQPGVPDNRPQTAGATGPTEEPPPAAQPEASPAKLVVIKLRTSQDDPIRGIGLEYACQSMKEYMGRREGEPAPLLVWRTATSDGDGCTVASLEPANLPGYLLVRPLSMVWRLAGDDFNLVRRDVPDAAAFEVKRDTSQVVVRVERNMRVRLDVRYSDGQSFIGHVRLSYWSQPSSMTADWVNSRLGLHELDLDGSDAYIEVPESTKQIDVHVVGYRFGWENPYRNETPVNAQMRSLTVVVPEARNPRAGIRVDLSGFSPGDAWKLRLSGGRTWSPSEPPKWGQEYKDYRLMPDFEYIVHISGPLGVWESEPFKLQPGEVREFVPRISEPVSYRLRVVDQQGQPVFPNYATTRFQGMPDWRMVRSVGSRMLSKMRDGTIRRRERSGNGESAPGDTAGVITLTGVPSTVKKLYVESEGFERTVVPLAGAPGDHVDLGDVVVVPAKGRITIKFTHKEPGEEFLVDIGKPRQGGGEAQTTSGYTHTFEGLSVNRGAYIVRALLPGLTGYEVEVTLSEDQPAAEIEIDARKIPRAGPSTNIEVAPSED